MWAFSNLKEQDPTNKKHREKGEAHRDQILEEPAKGAERCRSREQDSGVRKVESAEFSIRLYALFLIKKSVYYFGKHKIEF